MPNADCDSVGTPVAVVRLSGVQRKFANSRDLERAASEWGADELRVSGRRRYTLKCAEFHALRRLSVQRLDALPAEQFPSSLQQNNTFLGLEFICQTGTCLVDSWYETGQ